jgi:hypothetical protein
MEQLKTGGMSMVSMLKIGILTFHRCINYGSYWQARCLADGLAARGHHVVILDHHSRRINLAEWRCALRPDPLLDRSQRDFLAHRRKIRRFFRAFDALPLSPRFDLESPAEMEPCDTVVVGSDEVWNLSHPWYGRCKLFYGDGLRTDRLVAYAASFGNYDAGVGLEHAWAAKLRNFDCISVRDDNSRAIAEQACGFAPEVVLDPCLQFPPVLERGDGPQAPARYVALYGHGFSRAFAAHVTRWAVRNALPIVSIGYRNPWADEQRIDAGPDAFAQLIAGARAVATNFFHGCVFALLNRKPFACEASWYRGNKLRGLMACVGDERRLLPEGAPPGACEPLLQEAPDDAVIERIAHLRRRSQAFLDSALLRKVRLA